MESFAYAMGLISVLIALALGDIALSFRKILRCRGAITWDARVLVSTLLVIVTVLRMWFAFWTVRSDTDLLAFPFYLTIFIEMMLLFVLAASCLPDDEEGTCDLSVFYEKNRTYFWSTFAIFETSFLIHGLWFDDFQLQTWFVARSLIRIGSCVALAAFRSRWLHLVLPAALIAFQLIERWNQTLGGTPP